MRDVDDPGLMILVFIAIAIFTGVLWLVFGVGFGASFAIAMGAHLVAGIMMWVHMVLVYGMSEPVGGAERPVGRYILAAIAIVFFTGVLWVVFGVEHWVNFSIAAGTVCVAWIIMSVDERKRRRQEAEADRRRAEERDRREHREKQQGYRIEMIRLGEKSIEVFESMPKCLSSAETSLDRAENDFADSAFAPFWDSIENAAKTLAHFDKGLRDIEYNSSRYTELIKEYEDTPPEFPLARQSVAKLRVGSATAERMEALVRKAQRNFQFAMIYEQRKTNQILVAGFTSLAHALAQMTRQITASINGLSSSIGAIHSRMGDITEMASRHHKEHMEKTSEAAERQKKALEMLDNIQRGRRPFL